MALNKLLYFLCIKNAWEENKYKAVTGLFIIPHIAPISYFLNTPNDMLISFQQQSFLIGTSNIFINV